MSKFLILLLFALVQNLKSDGIEVYDVDKMKKLSGNNVILLNVKEGDEFYLMFTGSPSTGCSLKFTNYENITDALDDFGKKGSKWKSVDSMSGMYFPYAIGGQPYYYYYKFKSLKRSYNKIVLKFNYGRGENIYEDIAIKINISK